MIKVAMHKVALKSMKSWKLKRLEDFEVSKPVKKKQIMHWTQYQNIHFFAANLKNSL